MKKIIIKKTNPAFIEAVRAAKEAKKKRFEKYFEEINGERLAGRRACLENR